MNMMLLISIVFYYVGLFNLGSADDFVGENEESFSFHRFSGPVSGEVRKIIIPDANSHNPHAVKVDYVARPDYMYVYGVQDTEKGNSQTHQQARDGDKVHGEYRVLQADGKIRIVRYTADPTTGFKATVEYVLS